MYKITISDGENSVELLSKIKFKLGGEEVNKQAVMASAKIVKDVIGYRDVLEVPVGYLSLEQMSVLRDMIRKNDGFLYVSYPTPNGDITSEFVVEEPQYTAFKYDDEGVAFWGDVTIKAKTTEVIDV